MIGTVDVNIQAKFPNLPLDPFQAFINSASSVRVRNVPRKIGRWEITQVYVNLSYPDNTTVAKACVLTGGVWVGTVDGCATSGTCTNGFVVTASGIDEDGNAVSNYVLGAGDLYVKNLDGTISPETTAARMYFYDTLPSNPNKGDTCFTNGTMIVWNGTDWKQTYKNNPISYIEGQTYRLDADRTWHYTTGQPSPWYLYKWGNAAYDPEIELTYGWYRIRKSSSTIYTLLMYMTQSPVENIWNNENYYVGIIGIEVRLYELIDTNLYKEITGFRATVQTVKEISLLKNMTTGEWIQVLFGRENEYGENTATLLIADDIKNKLDDAAAAVNWVSTLSYAEGCLVTYQGKLYQAGGDVQAGGLPPNDPESEWYAVDYGEIIATINDELRDKANRNELPTKTSDLTNDSGFVTQSELPYEIHTTGETAILPADTYVEYNGTILDLTKIDFLYDMEWQMYYDGSYTGCHWPYNGQASGAVIASGYSFTDLLDPLPTPDLLLGRGLVNRAVNQMTFIDTGRTTLILPKHIGGTTPKARDFLLRLTISRYPSPAPTFSFVGNNETITIETEDGTLPQPDSEGTWLYSFTETAIRTFAVSLKKVQVVSQS